MTDGTNNKNKGNNMKKYTKNEIIAGLYEMGFSSLRYWELMKMRRWKLIVLFNTITKYDEII